MNKNCKCSAFSKNPGGSLRTSANMDKWQVTLKPSRGQMMGQTGQELLLSLLVWSFPPGHSLQTSWEDDKQAGDGLVFTEPKCLHVDANTVFGAAWICVIPLLPSFGNQCCVFLRSEWSPLSSAYLPAAIINGCNCFFTNIYPRF